MNPNLLATNPTPIPLVGQSLSVILRNVGGTQIPAHGLVEVTGYYTTGTTDPAPINGQVILQVRRPTKHVLFSLASAGPVAIPVGKQGPGYYGPVIPIGQGTAPGIGKQARATLDSFGVTAGTGPLLQLTSGTSVNLYAVNTVQQVFGFELTDAMGCESGEASIIDPTTGDVLEEEVTVYDVFQYFRGAMPLTKGFVIYCHDKWVCMRSHFSGDIEFVINSANLSSRTALVTISYRPAGCEVVPEEVGGIVTVHDTMGYFADETAADLVGRKGTAWYGQDSTDCNAPKWLVNGLMCDTDL